MKNIFFILLCFSTLYIEAQKQPIELTNADKFSEKSGSLIQKEFYQIGIVKKCTIDVVKLNDLMSPAKLSAVRFEFENESSDKIGSVDSDELDGLIKSLKLIQTKIFPTAPTIYTEITFKTRGGFSAGCFYSKENWTEYIRLDKYDSNSYLWINNEDMPELISILEKAKAKM